MKKVLLFVFLIVGLFCSCSDEQKAKSVVERYFKALSQNDTQAAGELFPNSKSLKLKDFVYKNPKITVTKQKGTTYEVDFDPAACLYVEKAENGDFVITDSRNVIDVQHESLNSQYNIAMATGAINYASTDVQVIKAEGLLRYEGKFFDFLKKKYHKYYYGDFKILSTKKDKYDDVVFVKVTYQTSIDAQEHAIVINGKDKDGNVVVTKQKNVEQLDAGHINSVSIMITGDVVNYIKDYEVNIGLILDNHPVYWLERCGAPFSGSDYKEFLRAMK